MSEKVIVPEEEIPVKDEAAPRDDISQVEEFTLMESRFPPIETDPVLVPVLMLVALLESTLRFMVAPEMSAPRVADSDCDSDSEPAKVIVPSSAKVAF